MLSMDKNEQVLSNINNVYQNISACINIDSEREKYTKLYDAVKKIVIDNLKEDVNFKSLFSDLHLCGSYADNLKITKPDEFDLIMRFKFPQNDKVKIKQDTMNKGNAIINLSEIFEELKRLKYVNMLAFLKPLVNDKYYFLENKFQCWLQGCFDKLIIKINKQFIDDRSVVYSLIYCRKGPAHTLKVYNACIRISIDFVPGFVFDASKATTKEVTRSWEAIPKPIKYIVNNPSFRCSYTDSERALFHNLNEFKNTLRIVKKLRDMQPKLEKFKSYYIKTLFLWQVKRSSADFWKSSTVDIINIMLIKWEESLYEGKLEYFWDPKLNLLKDLTQSQTKSMYYDLRLVKKSLQCCLCGKNIYDVFLSKDEQDQMYPIILKRKEIIANEKNQFQMQLQNYGKKLHNMSPAQRLLANKLICQILSEGENNNLTPGACISTISKANSANVISVANPAINSGTDMNLENASLYNALSSACTAFSNWLQS